MASSTAVWLFFLEIRTPHLQTCLGTKLAEEKQSFTEIKITPNSISRGRKSKTGCVAGNRQSCNMAHSLSSVTSRWFRSQLDRTACCKPLSGKHTSKLSKHKDVITAIAMLSQTSHLARLMRLAPETLVTCNPNNSNCSYLAILLWSVANDIHCMHALNSISVANETDLLVKTFHFW